MKNEKWFAKEISQIEKQLKTNAATGLSRKAARSRSNKGSGKLFLVPVRSPLQLLLSLCSDFSLIILLILAVISLFFEEAQNATVVLILLLGAILSGGILLFRSSRREESSEACFYPMARVVRGGRLFRVRGDALVPGDVILVEEGDLICCDARLVTSDRLRVSMRVDLERYTEREKVASTHVPEGENRAWEMTNMLHGGSEVLCGSGRAIVTAVGRYTYLGALTGGVELASPKPRMPMALRRMRELCSKTGLLLLAAVIPFTMISLLASAARGGTVLMSAAFLTALALVATTVSQLSCSLCQLFYAAGCRKLLNHPHGAAVRSYGELDRLASADYIFMLDGGAMTDGMLHFSTAYSAEGELKRYRDGSTASYLGELTSLYVTAASRTLTTGLGEAEGYLRGLREFVRHSGVDEGALAIRCSILSYGAGSLEAGEEQVVFSDQGRKILLRISGSPLAISRCNRLWIKGAPSLMSEEGRNALLSTRERLLSGHQRPLILSVSPIQDPMAQCFVGMVVLREGVDVRWQQHLRVLRQTGCRVIAFSSGDERLPKLPDEMMGGGRVRKEDFVKRNLPVTEQFGRFSYYEGMSEEDLRLILRMLRKKKKSVWLMGMGETARALSGEADGLISYAPIPTGGASHGYEVVLSADTPGQRSSMSCSHAVKERAGLLIPRPFFGRGGLASLANAVRCARAVHSSLQRFWHYLIWIQMLRLIVVGFPMLMGQTVLDARHVLLFSLVMDGFALFAIQRATDSSEGLFLGTWSSLAGDRGLLISTVLSSVSVLLLPEWVGLFGWIEPYFYKVEFCLSALLLLHLTLLILVCYGTRPGKLQGALKNTPLLLSAAFVVGFFTLCILWEGFGLLFGVEKSPLPYFLLSLVPSVLLAVIYGIFERKNVNNL